MFTVLSLDFFIFDFLCFFEALVVEVVVSVLVAVWAKLVMAKLARVRAAIANFFMMSCLSLNSAGPLPIPASSLGCGNPR